MLIDELKQSPEAMRLLPRELFDSLLSTVEGQQSGEPHESEPKSASEQETS